MKIQQFHTDLGPATETEIIQINVLLNQLSKSAKVISLSEFMRVAQNNYLFLARNEQNEIVGMATLCPIYKLAGLECRVEDVVVHESMRKKGIAELLMQALIKQAMSLKAKHIELTSNPKRVAANSLYLKLGYCLRETNTYRLAL